MKKFLVSGKGRYLALLLAVIFALSFAGCKGSSGSAGAPGTSTGTLAGTVTMSQTGDPVSGVAVAVSPSIQGVSITTAADGTYSASLPIGNYSVTYSKTNFASQTKSVSIVAGQTATQDVALVATANVIVSPSSSVASPKPGDTVSVTAGVTALDGSTVQSVAWSQTNSVTVTIATPDAATTDVTLPGAEAYKTELFDVIVDPSKFEPGYIDVLNRTIVQGVDPLSLEEAGAVTLTATVVTTSGTYTGTVAIDADLSDTVQVSTGVDNVGVGIPVLLHGKDMGGGFSWTLTTPGGSSAALDSATSQNPSFIPDVAGHYVATLTNGVGGTSTNTIDVYAGTWVGIISGQDTGGERTTDPSCMACHGTIAEAIDNFTPWKKSGHSEIFTDNVNTSTHYSTSCFPCHTVGYNLTASNNGIDDQADYQTFLDQFTTNGVSIHANPNNWTNMVANTPDVARRANIQCENCHGPQGTTAGHASLIGTGNSILPSRTSLAAEVCGSCHGEPPRHGRFQQWKESGHANFELAISEGMSTSCARCHSAQGYLIYVQQLEAGNTGSLPSSAITWTADTVQPQTCAACHPPHDPGDTSGAPGVNTAKVRVMGDTPMLPGGFAAIGVGKGAVCITCHNSRNGAHNDAAVTVMDDRAPHTASQGDVLMGENSFFLTGERSPHSLIGNACATCHLELSLPPAEFSIEGAGTNHTFKATLAICSQCHGEFNGGSLPDVVTTELEEVKTAIETAIGNEIANQVGLGNDVTLLGTVIINGTSAVSGIELTESHGRQAMNITVDGTTYSGVRLASDTQVGTGSDTLATSAAGQVIVRSGWNFFLLESDGSLGIHNPGFVLGVIDATKAELAAL